MELEWRCKKFNDLTVEELYAIMRLRNEVFVVEQNCVFQDADNKDQHCYHLAAWQKNNIAAYARLVPPGIIYAEPSIGRVITAASFRGTGIGRGLLQQAIVNCTLIFGEKTIKIGAQLYLKKMYESFGFQQLGDIYLEDGIEHIHMLRF
ncbi:MAG TPA: GNAT family N-acetyltransferase [Chitinophagaceae bacterium]|nr:GNAT family N-acetyltransferase [Chitinophagaceae bacterium]